MRKLVLDVGKFLGAVFLTMNLYVLFFGVYDLNGNPLPGVVDGSWRGLIYHVGLEVEKPVARYYYEYCLAPVLDHRGIDAALYESVSGGVSPVFTKGDGGVDGSDAVFRDLETTGRFHSTGWR